MRISIRSPRSATSAPALKQSTTTTVKLPPQPIYNLIGTVAMRSILAGPRSLRENGVHRFVENASIVCVGFQYREQLLLWCPNGSQIAECANVKIYSGSTLPPKIHNTISSGAKFIAHNCELERAVLRKIGAPAIPIENWIDTSALARAWMFPVELNRLVTALQIPTIAADNFLPSSMTFTSVPDAHTLNNLLNSAITEVIAIGAVVARLQCLPDTSETQTERRFFERHLEINERGICIDLDLVTAAVRIAEMELVQTDKKIQRITSGIINLSTLRNSNPDSASSLSAALKQKYQFDLPASDEDTILEVLGSSLLMVGTADSRQERRRKRVIKAILYARLRVASTGLGKLDSMLNQTSSDGRLRGQYVYYGSHTGRSSSRGVQLQNFSKPKEGVDVVRSRLAVQSYGLAIKSNQRQAAEDALQDLRDAAGARGIPAAIAACSATTLVAAEGHTLIMVDASQIENRLLFWLANDSENLALYRDFDAGVGKDPYCAASEFLKGGPVAGKKESPTEEDKDWRKVGKVCEISLGYQMGETGFTKRCHSEGIDLSKVGLTPEKCSAYRHGGQSHPKIAGRTGIWRVLERTIGRGNQGWTSAQAGSGWDANFDANEQQQLAYWSAVRAPLDLSQSAHGPV